MLRSDSRIDIQLQMHLPRSKNKYSFISKNIKQVHHCFKHIIKEYNYGEWGYLTSFEKYNPCKKQYRTKSDDTY